MEEKINIIKENLTGNHEEDLNYLYSFAKEKRELIDDEIDTLSAINSVIEELENTVSNGEVNKEAEVASSEELVEVDEQKKEQIDAMIAELNQGLEEGNLDEALTSSQNVINEVEELSKIDDETKLHCSFASNFEKNIFEYIFAGEKQVVITPYSNDVLYTIYADILVSKKRYKAALDALDRAIYWNFLSRTARSKKIDLYFQRNEIVKCLDAIKKLQSISYTAQDLAECYNKYAYVFESLKDPKSAYALYVVSYYYLNNDDVLAQLNRLAEENPELADMTFEESVKLARDNDVNVNPNTRIISAYRKITRDYINQGSYEDAMILIENDYSITKDEALNEVYDQLVALRDAVSEDEQTEESTEKNETAEETVEEVKETPKKRTRKAAAKTEEEVEEKPKKTTKRKTTAKKTTTKKATKEE